jgi:hypothetical protein
LIGIRRKSSGNRSGVHLHHISVHDSKFWQQYYAAKVFEKQVRGDLCGSLQTAGARTIWRKKNILDFPGGVLCVHTTGTAGQAPPLRRMLGGIWLKMFCHLRGAVGSVGASEHGSPSARRRSTKAASIPAAVGFRTTWPRATAVGAQNHAPSPLHKNKLRSIRDDHHDAEVYPEIGVE